MESGGDNEPADPNTLITSRLHDKATQMIVRILLLSAATCLLAATPTFRFPEIDTDQDGAIAWEEYAKIAAHSFIEADTNFDGSLTDPTEIMQLNQRLREADMIYFFRTADSNGDGYTDEAEFIAQNRERMEFAMNAMKKSNASFDADGDGVISQEERKIATKLQIEKRKGNETRISRIITAASNEMGICPSDVTDKKTILRSNGFDCDRDGVVTLNESRRVMRIRFNQRDLDGDGLLSGDELPSRGLFAY
ncbi:hypothetical protein GCM10007853_00620 [Algimonas ampicilliniresistens]|uniref:EF-hand domain-containing protein n=2 Tax=Algimonas ampicilliniresistens TaxID=1298735 RepID=A0ABQ5V3U7_9PROT|nr:hypothetical protein GCM10007853_00620 [Algimonas ampicilliniresistens]